MADLKENFKSAILIHPGLKIFCEGERACLKLEKELVTKGIKVRIGCNECNMWSVYIISVPDMEDVFPYIIDMRWNSSLMDSNQERWVYGQ